MTQIVDQYGKPITAERQRVNWSRVLARYDAAQTTDDNIRHWGNADLLSADAAHSPEVRSKLRSRSRYESANNSYCRSMVETLANDVIGTGPRVQIVTGSGTMADDFIEREISAWMLHTKLAKRLRTMRKAKAVDGEGIGLLTTKPKLPTPVKLAVKTIEADQLATPAMPLTSDREVDGIRFDENGDPTEYSVMRSHPGGSLNLNWLNKADWVAASDVIHVFREDRSGQHRGVPELTPALPLFSQLRRYTLAVLAAAETAADFAAVIQTNQPPGGGYGPDESGGVSVEAMDVFELSQRMVTVLPDGYTLGQVRSEQPTTTYGEFKREILAEAFASVVMPYAVGANDSKEYNFASGKLDRRSYAKAVAVERSIEWDPEVYRIVFSWYLEARLIPGYLPVTLPPFSSWNIQIFWDEVDDDIDPEKAARSRQIQLETGQTSFPTIFAGRGKDCDAEQSRQAKSLGLTLEQYRERLANKLLGPVIPQTSTQQPTNKGNANA